MKDGKEKDMPARDTYHAQFRRALVKDGWNVTADPFRLRFGSKDMYVDLGAEQILSAERGTFRIAVEIKSFVGPSEMSDLESALGQYVLYNLVLQQIEPDRVLYLAVREATFRAVFQEPLGQLLITNERLKLIVFNEQQEEVKRWIPELPTAS